MNQIRKDNSQYEGQYYALVVKKGNQYFLNAFDSPTNLLGELSKSISRGNEPVRAFQDVSWKALSHLEKEVINANKGEEVSFNDLFK